MSEGKCYFCNTSFWTERIVVCLDCLRELRYYKEADFIFVVKGEYRSVLLGSDIKFSLELLEKFIIPNLKRKLEKKEKEAKLKQKPVPVLSKGEK